MGLIASATDDDRVEHFGIKKQGQKSRIGQEGISAAETA